MRLDDDRKRPLADERSDLYWGSELTYTERDLEDLDLLWASANAPAVDRAVAAPDQAPAATSPSSAAGPTSCACGRQRVCISVDCPENEEGQ